MADSHTVTVLVNEELAAEVAALRARVAELETQLSERLAFELEAEFVDYRDLNEARARVAELAAALHSLVSSCQSMIVEYDEYESIVDSRDPARVAIQQAQAALAPAVAGE